MSDGGMRGRQLPEERARSPEEIRQPSKNRPRYSIYFLVTLLILLFLVKRWSSKQKHKYEEAPPEDREEMLHEIFPSFGSGEIEVDIELSEEDLDGQFDRLADEFALSKSQLDGVRSEIESIVEEKTKGKDVDSQTKEAMANVMASTIRQEMKQLEGKETNIGGVSRLWDWVP